MGLFSGDLSKLLAANVWVNFVFLMTFVVLGLILSNVEFGAFRVAQAYIAVATTIAMLGLNTAVTHLFPRMSPAERKAALPVIQLLVVVSSLIAGVILYGIVPTTGAQVGFFQQALYFSSFPLIVAGAAICNIALAVMQANGELAAYSKFQIFWKSSLFVAALAGAFFLDALSVLIAMALIYPVFLLLSSARIRRQDFVLDWSVLHRLGPQFFKSAIWPFAAACASIVYANLEFLSIGEVDLSSGLAGDYSLASLIFIGGAALFLPFQTFAGSRVVNRRITLSGLFGLQAICLATIMLVAICAYGVAQVLHYLDPVKFSGNFLDFAFLVCLKLSVWGSYAVIGSVLYYLDKGFQSFILSLFALSATLLAFFILDVATLRDVVIVQILSSVLVMLGSAWLAYAGFRKRDLQPQTQPGSSDAGQSEL
ncbi:lipopolysaccharide biosynthesis protein [Devosia chinhatensis]|uniref:Polysaccharide biosynthesis protein C-terminal domain-containing protein n=1 Tax=Devosia chinhatensis TaxID=429727 RepID=A0A0F5FKZ1_9HYPH|nr:hypothetical protein [Devosia chinhatensis]KKB08892.1 hypothetical protein VE26_02250 [Devosia chinhatensis]